jgi:hypothetical protein
MTREQDNVVKLSVRDWMAIGGLVLAVSGAVLGSFIHHDRLLMRVVTQQESINARLDKIERQLDPR